ncbi:hypothetical protein PT974_03791 [Cladobotryum mycophilum]|uniref:Uncharacterized protein n=1 Tax=Cladobotryum mycophilum TaxID=491253 RepID=A0ABR0STX7_9HYPO
MQTPRPSIPRFVSDLRFINLIFGLVWLLSLRYLLTKSYYDPSSFFFRRDDAYEPIYSAVREQEADNFISSIQSSDSDQGQGLRKIHGSAGEKAPFCLGIPSLQREQSQFLPRTLASLVDFLDPDERELLHIVVLLSDDNAATNSAFGQKWLHTIADTVLVHEDTADLPVVKSHYHKIPRLPPKTDRSEHMRQDFAKLLETCRQLNTEYFILVEDDVIASRDWFRRLRRVLPEVNSQAYSKSKDWLYLRLFYSETYMGWNSEEWPIYIKYIALVYVATIAVLFGLRQLYHLVPVFSKERLYKTSRLLPANILIIWLPMFIGLYFMAGRLTVQPLTPGVHEMPQYGCCSQGLVLPRRHMQMIEATLISNPYDLPGDSSIETLAEEKDLAKWAIVPSVLQHTGIRGSSAKGAARKWTWNFNFERVYTR